MTTPYHRPALVRSVPPARIPQGHLAPRPQSRHQFMTVKEVAAELRVSKMAVYRLTEDLSLPSTRIGRNIRIERRDLEAYLADARQDAS